MSGICKNCCRCGYKDEQIGQPCESCKDGIIVRDPPFSELVDTLPEPMTCGRRFDTYVGNIPVHSDREEGKDRWQRFKSNGDRVCSYCGSLHWEDMLRLVHVAATAPEDAPYNSVVRIKPSDKQYKIYVHQAGVRNASEGAIKFYTQHLPRDKNGKILVTDDQQAEYVKAVELTQKRFYKYLAEKYPHK